MLMCNLLECSDNFSKISGSLWNYRGEVNDDDANAILGDYRINNNKTIRGRPLEYETRIIGNKQADNNILYTEFVFPLNCFNYFWRLFDFPLINCEIEFGFK